MMEQINSHILKLTGRAELPQAIETGHNYHIAIEGSIPKVEIHDQEDGTFNRVYTFRAIKVDVLTPQGKTLKLKDTRSLSQLFRARLWKKHLESKTELPFDKWYELLMQRMIQQVDEVAELYGE